MIRSLSLLVLMLTACTGAPQDGWPGVAASGDRTFALSPHYKLLALSKEARSRGETFPARGEWQFPRNKDDKLSGTYSTPVVVDGTVYITTYAVGGLFGRLYAINAENGESRWDFSPGGTSSSIVSSPTVADGTIYFGSADHRIYAVDAATGQKKWDFETRNKVWAGVRVEGTNAYAGSLDHHFYALDKTTGERRWEFKTGGPIASTAAFDKESLYFGAGDGSFYALDAATGSARWVFQAGSWLWGTPLIKDGVIYAGSLGKQVFALDAATGQRKWAFDTFGAVSATPVLLGPSTGSGQALLAVADQTGRVYALNPETGTRRWEYLTDPQAPIHSALATDGSRVYVMSLNRKFVALNADGRPEWTCPTGGDQVCR